MSADMPLISVIVPVYNTKAHLARCIGSILEQTYEHLEVILVDDGSTDGSGALCDAFAARDSRVQVLHQRNGGSGAARNAGLERCTGAYVAFVDSDDYLLPQMYDSMRRALEEHRAAVCVCQWQYQRGGEWVVDSGRVDPGMFGSMSCREFARGLYKGAYENGLVVSVCNKLYRRELFRELRFEGCYAEDDALHTALFSGECSVYVMREQYYVYVEHPGSLSRRGFRAESLRILDILAQRTERFREDPFLVRESKRTYCNLYIEYSFKAKRAGILMPPQIRFRTYARELVRSRECGLKFALRMGLFALCPALYRILLVR